jgi:DNA-binding NtrC family response regulator
VVPKPQTVAGKGAGGLKSVARCAREEAEADAIRRALHQTNWNRKQAAEQLKISYKALLYKIREYELLPPLGQALAGE